MKCERCRERDATQAVRADQDGRSTELFVCDQCARAQHPATPPVMSMADILFSLGQPGPQGPAGDGQPAAAAAVGPGPRTICPGCGMTSDVLRELRRFGCPQCYRTFPALVTAFLRELQYGERHTGKIPRNTARHRQIEALRRKMAAAIKAQRYEKAAALRDKLLALSAEAHPETSPTERDDAR